MSYKAFLNFTHTDDFLGLIQKVYKDMDLDLKDILLDMWPSLPSFNTKPRPKLPFVAWAHDANTIQCHLTRNFLFWPEYKLAAILGDQRSLGQHVYKRFPAHIYFQNQSDTDYELDIYQKIGLFRNICSQVQNDGITNQYELRTQVYERICKMLDLEAWIYDENPSKIQTLAIQFIRSQTDEMRVREEYTKLHNVINEEAEPN